MSLSLRPNLASIPPHIPFLDALASWWLATHTDPLTVADGLFLVPTRRAARGLSEAFLRASHGAPLLLPRIAALGGLDEAPLAMADALSLPPAVPAARRLAVLSRFILAMGGENGAPTQADRAWVLAEELARLLDEAARAEIDLAEALPRAAGEAFASHWQVTLEFLTIVTRLWPAWLAEEGFSDAAAGQIALLNAQTEAWRANPPSLPVVAAGSTGAIPAVGRLLRLVAHLPAGMVVLPGLDRDLDEPSWDALDETHPQASLRALLSALAARREDVRDWSDITPAPAPLSPPARADLLRTALLPAASLSAWQAPHRVQPDGLSRLEPADQQEEAQAIALILRGALEQTGARAALVTPDRQLARRVAAELLRFGIVADDSAGEPLTETPPAVFLRLLAQAVAEQLRPVPLLALLKHPLCAAGLSPAACRQNARQLEREALRGPRPAPGLPGLRAAAKSTDAFLDRLESCLQPVLPQPAGPPDQALAGLLEAAEALATTDEAPGSQRLWAGEDGAALATHLSGLREALALLPPQDAAALPTLLDAVLAGAPAVRSRRSLRGRSGTEHPRIFIWGLLEARLQSADVIVLGGLSEGTWPGAAESGPWMNRAMRANVGLPSPEEAIGLAAHDFVMASCAAPVAVLSAPARRDGAPAVPARWLVRLDALLNGSTGARLHRHPAALWVRALDRPDGPPQPVSPPAPCPPIALRPRKLSVTEIETWLRDPYAIHARHILRLRKLDPLEQAADAADYGSIVHAGLHRFFARIGLGWPADAAEQLMADMDAALDDAEMRPALAAWWRPRLRRIAAWAAEAERDRRAVVRPTLISPEVKGVWTIDAPAGPFTLQGRADRIERRPDGTIAILDYKTGAPPTSTQVAEGRAPQLPLEAAMAEAGAFGAELAGPVTDLTYWHIAGGYEPGAAKPLFQGKAEKIAAATEMARESFKGLVASFDDAARAYLSQPSPGAAPRFSDYARLARVAEWAAAEE